MICCRMGYVLMLICFLSFDLLGEVDLEVFNADMDATDLCS